MKLRLLLVLAVSGWSLHLFAGLPFELNQEASFIVAHAKATGHSFDAIPEKYLCEIELNDDSKGLQSVSFSFDFADLKTGDQKRDKEMRHWLDTETFPALEFKATGWATKNGQSILQGQLSFHGQSRAVEIVMEVKREGDNIDLKGYMPLITNDYGLKPIRKMLFLKVNPLLRVEFHLIGTVAAENRGGE